MGASPARDATAAGATLARVALAVFVAFLALRLLLISSTMVIDDESYYYVWTNHLAAGYIDAGPVIAFVNKAFVLLLGASSFSLRLPAVLMLCAVTGYAYLWGKKRYGEPAGLVLSLLLTTTPLFFANSVLHTYDTEMGFFLLLAVILYHDAYLVSPRYFCPAGLCLGLALLSKVSAVFAALAIFLFPFVVRQRRGVVREIRFWISFVLAFLVFLPFIVWNLRNDLAFVKFVAGMVFREGSWSDFVQLWVAQAALLGPVLLWMSVMLPFRSLLASARASTRESSAESTEPALYFALIGAVPLSYCAVGSFFSRYYANWVGPAFVGGIVLAALRWGQAWERSRRVVYGQVAVAAGVVLLLLAQIWVPFLPLGGRADITNRYFRYSALRDELPSYLDRHPEYASLRILSNNYQIPSMINLYARPAQEAIGLSLAGYHDTLYSMLYPSSELVGGTYLFCWYGETFPAAFRAHFGTVTKLETFVSRREEREIERFTLWLVTGFTGRSGQR